MPRKAKEKEINVDILNVSEKEELDTKKSSTVKVTKKTTTKTSSASTKKSSKTATSATAKARKSKKDEDAKIDINEVKPKTTRASKTSTSKESANKVTKAIANDKSSIATKKSTTKNTESKKSSTSKASSKKVDSKDLKSESTKTRKTVTKKEINEEVATLPSVSFEYYDLPYRYNHTVVKLLAQNPNTLFVYWEISDEDRQTYINKYGENFFYTTRPILVVHNLTDKYSFEIDINDFANNWYIHVENSKCQYVVELGRRPIQHHENIDEDYLYVASSNLIESPNDHVLFFNDNDKIYFKNIHTNQYSERVIKPFLKNICGIYNNLHITSSDNSFDFNNPSSQNPSSTFK